MWALLFQGKEGDEILKSPREKRGSSWLSRILDRIVLQRSAGRRWAGTTGFHVAKGMRIPKKVNSVLSAAASTALDGGQSLSLEPPAQDPAGLLPQGSILT